MTDTAGTLDRTHPVDAALSAINAHLDDVSDAVLWSLGDAAARDLLTCLTTTGARLAELEARVAAHAATVEAGEAAGATSTATGGPTPPAWTGPRPTGEPAWLPGCPPTSRPAPRWPPVGCWPSRPG